MGQLFREGQTRIRPGISYRYSNRGKEVTDGAKDGVNAFVMNADWGPVGEVVKLTSAKSVKETFGEGDSVDAAMAIFNAGANTVYIYRPEGQGEKQGARGTVTLDGNMTVTAKYPGKYALKVKVQQKAGDELKRQLLVLVGTTVKEIHTVDAGETEAADFCDTIEKNSTYVTAEKEADGRIDDTAGTDLTGGEAAELTVEDYAEGFDALKPYHYGYLSADTNASEVAELMAMYVTEANTEGKLIVGVTGSDDNMSFEDRIEAAKSFNNASMIYLGNGYKDSEGDDSKVEGVRAVAYTAGLVSATPSNQSIVHSIIPDGVDVIEKLTNAQYEKAILSGMLLISVGPDGQVWYDSGVNTLTEVSALQDEGWKKIKRVKVRNELMDRLDRCLAVKIGRVNCDKDGVADVLQGGIGVINNMINEGKLLNGSTMYLDPDMPPEAASAWFIIDADDIDSLEKIYLHYQFRYSQNV